jgi:hypothetical protein
MNADTYRSALALERKLDNLGFKVEFRDRTVVLSMVRDIPSALAETHCWFFQSVEEAAAFADGVRTGYSLSTIKGQR